MSLVYKSPDPHLVSRLITQAKQRNPKEPITLILYPIGTWHLHEGSYVAATDEITETAVMPLGRFSVKELAKAMVAAVLTRVPEGTLLRKRQIPDGRPTAARISPIRF